MMKKIYTFALIGAFSWSCLAMNIDQPAKKTIGCKIVKAKRNQISVACDNCRRKHQRCDNNNPCDRCKEAGIECKRASDNRRKKNVGVFSPILTIADNSNDEKNSVPCLEWHDYLKELEELKEFEQNINTRNWRFHKVDATHTKPPRKKRNKNSSATSDCDLKKVPSNPISLDFEGNDQYPSYELDTPFEPYFSCYNWGDIDY